MEHTIYNYTPTQARVAALHDFYRTSLMNARYYARLLRSLKTCNLVADITVALTSSAAFIGFAIWRSDEGTWVLGTLVATSAIISALRPVLRIPDKLDRYSKLHYGYLELFYRIESLVSEMRAVERIDEDHLEKASELSDRFRALELEGDAYQNQKKLLKDQEEIERTIPADRLWLPSQ